MTTSASTPNSQASHPSLPSRALARSRAAAATEIQSSLALGRLPLLSLSSAVGLALIMVAYSNSRAGVGNPEWLFWLGLLIIAVPIGLRLLSNQPVRPERLGLVVLLGLTLYLVKVIHSPYAFTFSDELVHLHNAEAVLSSGALFNDNTVLPVTPLYPGLSTVSAALASLTGLSTFVVGLVIIGSMRLIAILALFLFYEQIGQSSRVAGLATLIYAANANFLFWSAQYAYESLALPLAIMVLYVVARRERETNPRRQLALTVVAFVGILVVVASHHLTSYFLAAFLLAWAAAQFILRRWDPVVAFAMLSKRFPRLGLVVALGLGRQALPENDARVRPGRGPLWLALLAAAASALWLIYVANPTLNYLLPVLVRAVQSVVQMMAREQEARQLFQSSSGVVAPLWERAVGIGSVLLSLLGLPWGARRLLRQYHVEPVAWLLLLSALGYFSLLGLRFTQAAWETGNRASEFLYLGLAFVLALACVAVLESGAAATIRRTILTASFAVIFAGGVISGWAPKLRLSQPYQVGVGQVVLLPQGRALADWAARWLRTPGYFASDESNGRLLLAYANQQVRVGRYPNIKGLLEEPFFDDVQLGQLADQQIRFVVVDRRIASWDPMFGYYFDLTRGGPIPSSQLFQAERYTKWETLPGVDRLLDTGSIYVYDVNSLSHATAQP